MAEKKDFRRLVNYLRTVEYAPEDHYIMEEIAFADTDIAEEYASRYYQTSQREVLLEKILEIMIQKNCDLDAIAFLQTTLTSDDAEYSGLQTQLFKLMFAKDVKEADELLHSNKYTQYDKWTVSNLCIENGLYSRAISLYASRELLFKSDNRLSANPVYTELSKFLLKEANPKYWGNAIDTLLDKEDDQERLGSYELFEVNEESQFGCLMRAILDGSFLAGIDDVKVIYSLLESLIKYKKKFWLKHVLSNIIKTKSAFANNMTIQTLMCLSTLLFRETEDFQPAITNMSGYDHFTVAKAAKVMGHVEDSFRIYERFREFPQAADVLVYDIQDLARALEFADKVDKDEVWPIVGKGILESMRQNTKLRLELRKAAE
eukprot:NODE_54_length_30443_cov_1.442954.p11 type:complete len:375 gc:universal NODE_54_length_30443_cov_1.442954:7553-8677(+)